VEIVLVSHGQLAVGMLDTLQMIIGKVTNVHAIAAYSDDNTTRYIDTIRQMIAEKGEKDFFIITDIMGGSVNTEVSQILRTNPHVRIITGMNLPLLMALITYSGPIDEQSIQHIVSEAQKNVVYVNPLMHPTDSKEEL
jgi:mannose/fructose-specific phosphotransferase system component IIA